MDSKVKLLHTASPSFNTTTNLFQLSPFPLFSALLSSPAQADSSMFSACSLHILTSHSLPPTPICCTSPLSLPGNGLQRPVGVFGPTGIHWPCSQAFMAWAPQAHWRPISSGLLQTLLQACPPLLGPLVSPFLRTCIYTLSPQPQLLCPPWCRSHPTRISPACPLGSVSI